MKKLMILAVAAMMSIVANAATANWYVSDIDASGLKGYFFQSKDVSRNDVITALALGDTAFLDNGFADDFAVADGELYGTTDGHGNLETVTGFAVIFNTAAAPQTGDKYFLTSEESAATGGSGQDANLNFDGSGTAVASNWTEIGGTATPEPTSGLLLLIGVAGLALRRRRA